MEHRKLFTEYRSLTGLKHIAYLYDMEEKEYHYIKDERICESDCNCFIPYNPSDKNKKSLSGSLSELSESLFRLPPIRLREAKAPGSPYTALLYYLPE